MTDIKNNNNNSKSESLAFESPNSKGDSLLQNEQTNLQNEQTNLQNEQIKKGRGRPPKSKSATPIGNRDPNEPPRRRGRPSKKPTVTPPPTPTSEPVSSAIPKVEAENVTASIPEVLSSPLPELGGPAMPAVEGEAIPAVEGEEITVGESSAEMQVESQEEKQAIMEELSKTIKQEGSIITTEQIASTLQKTMNELDTRTPSPQPARLTPVPSPSPETMLRISPSGRTPEGRSPSPQRSTRSRSKGTPVNILDCFINDRLIFIPDHSVFISPLPGNYSYIEAGAPVSELKYHFKNWLLANYPHYSQKLIESLVWNLPTALKDRFLIGE